MHIAFAGVTAVLQVRSVMFHMRRVQHAVTKFYSVTKA